MTDMTLSGPMPDSRPTTLSQVGRPPRPSALSNALVFGWRAILKFKHVPEQLFDVTAFPIMMILMFTYLFGGALAGSPEEYIQYLLPGITVTSVVMITMYTGVAVNTDIEKGVFDRFRTLPIWRPAPSFPSSPCPNPIASPLMFAPAPSRCPSPAASRRRTPLSPPISSNRRPPTAFAPP